MPTDAPPDNPALARAVAQRLAVTGLHRDEPPCHGRANCCICPRCIDVTRAKAGPFTAPPRIRQPWEPT